MRNQQRLIVTSLSAVLAAGATALFPLAASAQLVLEEVVVTARKREETLQETPIAVTALTGENLQELGLTNISDLRKVVPNVDMYEGNGASGTGNVFIRGVGARNTGVNFDSGVGIYVDGVYVSRPDGAVLDNVDLQRSAALAFAVYTVSTYSYVFLLRAFLFLTRVLMCTARLSSHGGRSLLSARREGCWSSFIP